MQHEVPLQLLGTANVVLKNGLLRYFLGFFVVHSRWLDLLGKLSFAFFIITLSIPHNNLDYDKATISKSKEKEMTAISLNSDVFFLFVLVHYLFTFYYVN